MPQCNTRKKPSEILQSVPWTRLCVWTHIIETYLVKCSRVDVLAYVLINILLLSLLQYLSPTSKLLEVPFYISC